jgi:hypothetical protein
MQLIELKEFPGDISNSRNGFKTRAVKESRIQYAAYKDGNDGGPCQQMGNYK